MKMNTRINKKNITLILIPIILLFSFIGYLGWNSANPKSSCASCHEISPSVETSLTSAHREIECSKCHGTAFSNGLHSVTEKINMFFTHLSDDKQNQRIMMSEEQVVEIMSRCQECHRTQYADWNSGGHSVTYGQIFLNEKHNKMEQPYWDCFRCHGMFYEGNIYDLVNPIDNEGPWKFKDINQSEIPVIPCLACHQIHSKNETRQIASNFDDPRNIFYEREDRSIPFGFYIRADQIFLRADFLREPDIYMYGKRVDTPGENDYKLCIQCHSPNYLHELGTEDDRTPAGVHEGLTCNSCHEVHSNDARNLCGNCHPAISNCGLDVTKMNTTYFSSESLNNIHFVECKNCHPKMKN